MLLATRESARWRRRAYVATAALAGSYGWYAAATDFPHGGSALGLAYGGLALAAILALLWFGVRKRSYKSTWGRLETWLHVHVYLGLLSVVVVLFHTGFRFADRVAVAAFAVLVAVVVSGLVGAIFYTSMPRRLTAIDSDLTAAQISEQLNQLARAMARLASGRSAALQRVYEGLLAEARPARLAGWRVLARARRRRRGDEPAAWAAEVGRVRPAEQEDLRQLLVLYRQHQELHARLAAQQRYRNLLDVWLWVHLPLSLVLLVLVAAHVAGALFFSPAL
jgi:predicted membrane channel-forming protein YqfA (hemolysin III family)